MITSKIKATITLILFVSVFFPNLTSAQVLKLNPVFSDIQTDSAEAFYTSYLFHKRVVSGFSDGEFKPARNLTRGEMAKILFFAFAEQVQESSTFPADFVYFPDVDKNNKFFNAIHTLKLLNVVSGYSDGTFRPEENIDRDQITKFIVNLIKINSQDKLNSVELVDANQVFVDLEDTNKYLEYISILYSVGKDLSKYDQIFSLRENKLFQPLEKVTRGQMAKMLTNAMIIFDPRSESTVLPALGKLTSSIKPNQVLNDDPYAVYVYDDFDFIVLKTKQTFNFNFYDYNPPTFEVYVKESNPKYLINGSFFGVWYDNEETKENMTAAHAGYLRIRDKVISPVKRSPDPDYTQLTHVIIQNVIKNQSQVLSLDQFNEGNFNSDYIIFQTGPAANFGRSIQHKILYESKEPSHRSPKTLIGFDDNGKDKYLFISKQDLDHYENALIMNNMALIEGNNIKIVNLDGAKSTAFYSKQHPNLNFNLDKRLPNVIEFD
ncbi:S-layer homology domain-containing protein [Candidatus Dojkabacteria bacterium]|nr:S-layer homology domain-containing protein [Candidatus Dojkabacteria bacterium]